MTWLICALPIICQCEKNNISKCNPADIKFYLSMLTNKKKIPIRYNVNFEEIFLAFLYKETTIWLTY